MDDTVAKMLAHAAELIRVASEMAKREPAAGDAASLELSVQPAPCDAVAVYEQRRADLDAVLFRPDGSRRFTNPQLAHAMGVSRSAVTHWQMGRRRMPDSAHKKVLHIAEKLADPKDGAGFRFADLMTALNRDDGSRRMTLAQLARILGVSESAVQHWSKGRHAVPVEMHQRIVALLEVLG